MGNELVSQERERAAARPRLSGTVDANRSRRLLAGHGLRRSHIAGGGYHPGSGSLSGPAADEIRVGRLSVDFGNPHARAFRPPPARSGLVRLVGGALRAGGRPEYHRRLSPADQRYGSDA